MREYSVPASFTVGENDNIVGAVYSHERDDPDHVIFQRLVDGSWVDVTCAQAAQQIRSAAKGLIAAGVAPGDRVAILSATRYEWPILDFAILSVGAVTVPIYETSSAEQVQFVLSDSGAVAAFAETDEHAGRIEQQRATLPALQSVYCIDGSGAAALEELAEAGRGVDDAAVEERLAGIRSADPATLIYTSGTTGRPKGCQLTHSNLLYEIRGAKACFPDHLAKGEKLLVFLPLAHVLARALTIGAFTNGVTLGFTSDIKNLVPMFSVFQPTLVVSVPRVFEKVYNTAEQNAENDGKGKIFTIAAETAIAWSEAQDTGGPGLVLRLKHAVFDKLVYGKLRAALGGHCHAAISGGAPLGARLGHFYRGVGLSIYEGYGLTETSAAITVNRVGELRVGSVGKLLPGNSMYLGEDGELMVKGGVVFGGYWGNEEETNKVFTDGWFHTGDLGSMDTEGFVKITGRKKELMKTSGGKYIAPAKIEAYLKNLTIVQEAVTVADTRNFATALIAIDPEELEEWAKQTGNPADPQSIAVKAAVQTHVDETNKKLSSYETIKYFRIVPPMTVESGLLTASLKVKRKVVHTTYAELIDEMYNSAKR